MRLRRHLTRGVEPHVARSRPELMVVEPRVASSSHVHLDSADIGSLTPAEQLWITVQGIEENGWPAVYVFSLRVLADRLEEVGWWLAEPFDRTPTSAQGPDARVSHGPSRSL